MFKSIKATQVILFVTWVAFLLRTNQLDSQSLWRDEVDAIRFSSWSLPELVQGLFQAGHNGPLFFLLLRPWRSLTGDSEFALRYPSVLMGTVALPLAFVLTRQLGLRRQAGILLGLLLATSPYLVWYGQEAKMYTVLVALLLLAFIAYLKALSVTLNSSRWWLIFIIATTLSFYTHILSPLILLVYGLVALITPRQLQQRWRGWSLSMACLTLPYLPLALWQFPLLLNGFQSGHPFYPFSQQFSWLLQLYSQGLLQPFGIIPQILFLFLFLCGLFLRGRTSKVDTFSNSPRWRPRFILAAWTLIPPLAVYLISLRVQIFEDRYLIYIVPAFYLVIVLGLLQIKQYASWLAAFCLGIILIINLSGIWEQQRQPLKADFRAAAAYIAQQTSAPPVIMVQTPYLQHTLNYYYPAEYHLLEGLWTNGGQTETDIDNEMTTLTRELNDLWLVVSEEDLWDQRHLTRSWLEEHATLAAEAHFMRVAVYYFQFREDKGGEEG
jgi:uncharacterized membrane protein